MQVLNIFHVLIAIAMVALVLVQRGAGATAGAAFGSGASGTVFGSRGAGNFLTRSTWVLATLFCAISLTMAVVVSRTAGAPDTDLGVVSSVPASGQPVESAPAADALPPPSEAAQESDLPPLEMSTGSANPTGEQAPAVDLPSLDGGGESGDGAAAAESAAGADDAAGSEPTGDGS